MAKEQHDTSPDGNANEHDWYEQAITWLVNDTLASGQATLLREHMANCPQCEADYAAQLTVRRTMQDRPTLDYAPGASLAKLNTRIDRQILRRRTFRRIKRLFYGDTRTTRLTLAAQALSIALLVTAVVFLVTNEQSVKPTGGYNTLSYPAPTQPHLQVVFAPQVTATSIDALIDALPGNIVSGPTDGGVYVVALTQKAAGGLEIAAATLRTHTDVLFVAVRKGGSDD